MKRILIITTSFLALALTLLSGVLISNASTIKSTSTSSVSTASQPGYLPIDYGVLQKTFGMVVQPSSITPTVSADQIKTIASTFPEYTTAQNVHYELVQMTFPSFNSFSQSALARNPKLKTDGYIKNLPVWLISFQGLNIPSMNQKATVYDHETIYVIDASTDEMLFGFNYR